jgi:hypothetical protein
LHKKILSNCKNCGKVFYARRGEVLRGYGKYCSLSCSSKANYKPKNHKGSNNPNWKGGISKNNYHYKLLQIERYPEKIKARVIAQRAIKSGKLIKKNCEVCGDTDTHMHHDDYNKPLDIHWLCRKHHREIHHGMNFNKKTELMTV